MFVDSKMGDDIVGVVIPEMEEKKSEAEYKKYSSGIKKSDTDLKAMVNDKLGELIFFNSEWHKFQIS